MTSTCTRSEPRDKRHRNFKIPKPEDLNSINTQNVMRVKVNRVSILQVLRVEDVLDYLKSRQVLKEKEVELILSGETRQEKVRWLIDLLACRSHSSTWYKHFYSALSTCSVEPHIRLKYNALLGFLDNTIIRRPGELAYSPSTLYLTSPNLQYPRYDPLPDIQAKLKIDEENEEQKNNDDITNNEGETDTNRSVHVRGMVDFWIDEPLKSSIHHPEEHFQRLKNSKNAADLKQLSDEKLALLHIQNFEVTFVAYSSGKLPDGFVFCMAEAVQELLSDVKNYFLLIKYLNQMKLLYLVEPIKCLTTSFCNFATTVGSAKIPENRDLIVKLGFKFFDLLQEYGSHNEAEIVMATVLRYLASYQCLETLTSTYEASVKLAHVRNINHEYKSAHSALNIALQVGHVIELMSFGQDILDKTGYYLELSYLQQKYGNHISGLDWAHKALKNVKTVNENQFIDVLCIATQAYIHRLQIQKAGMLAKHAVQQACEIFGMNHPVFVKSLLNYIDFSNAFIMDEEGINIAKMTLNLAKKIYGVIDNSENPVATTVESVVLAHTHLAVSTALQVAESFDKDAYLQHANTAYQIAGNCLGSMHPSLATFQENLVSCMIIKARRSEMNSNDWKTAVVIAETEAKTSMNTCVSKYGDISWRSGMSSLKLADVLFLTGRTEEAENEYLDVLERFKICLNSSSCYHKQAYAVIGRFYLRTQRPLEALTYLEKSLERIDTGGIYVKWMHDAFINLLEACKSTDDSEHDNYSDKMSKWLTNSKPFTQTTWEDLIKKPESFEQFMKTFDALRDLLIKAKDEIKFNFLNEV
ncbi:uncharacterized protein LOC141900284 isoform X2 [Tubulanus polymorphus]|uniref:uncharacterized protein LOC141900284 isoform X2 n=1 Tax=Tubulanus polymorphus TaxID=672921 RepID=UPI003DA62F17